MDVVRTYMHASSVIRVSVADFAEEPDSESLGKKRKGRESGEGIRQSGGRRREDCEVMETRGAGRLEQLSVVTYYY